MKVLPRPRASLLPMKVLLPRPRASLSLRREISLQEAMNEIAQRSHE